MLGFIYGRLGDSERSLRHLERALETGVASPFVNYLAALAAADRGDRDEAARLVDRAIALGQSRELVKAEPALRGIPIS